DLFERPRLAVIAAAALVAHAVRRRVVVPGAAFFVVGLVDVVLAPVGVFDRRIDLLGDALAGESACYGAHRSANRGAHGASDCARSCTCGCATGHGPKAYADRVCARRAADRIPIRVLVL